MSRRQDGARKILPGSHSLAFVGVQILPRMLMCEDSSSENGCPLSTNGISISHRYRSEGFEGVAFGLHVAKKAGMRGWSGKAELLSFG
jgi:hypothetical protein